MPDRTPRSRASLLAALALLAAPPLTRPAAAQPIAPDTRVRITATGAKRPVVGLLRAVGADTVAVHDAAGRPFAWIARSEVHRFEVSRGRESRGAARRRGALRGALIGVGAGALLGGLGDTCRDRDGDPRTCEDEVSAGGQVAGAAAAAGAVGALIGGLVARPRERWTAAELPARVGVVPFGRGGAMAIVAVRF
jgi:hypothetical protein